MKSKFIVFCAVLIVALFSIISHYSVSIYAQDQTQSRQYTPGEKASLLTFYTTDLLLSLESEVNATRSLLKRKWVGIGIIINLFLKPMENAVEAFGEANVFVGGTLKNSPAAKAGVMRGGAIVKINGQAFKNPEDFFNLIRGDGEPGHEVKLRVFKEGGWYGFKMKTVLFGVSPDRKSDAEALETELYNTGRDFISRIKKLTLPIIEKLESGGPLTDADISELDSELNSVLLEFDSWLKNQHEKALDFIETLSK